MPVSDELPLERTTAGGFRSDWPQLELYLEHHTLSPLEGWKHIYEEWRAAYEYFRSLEQQTLYVSDEANDPIAPNVETLHFHGKLLRLLVESGERCLSFLVTLPLAESEEMERIEYNSRLYTLLDSLKESLILWHSAEPASAQSIRQLFPSDAR
jgi:hypothetical protein